MKPALQRVCRGSQLAANDPDRYRNLRNYWLIAKILLGVAAVVLLHQRQLEFILLLCVSGFVLLNSAILTGREFENFHWLYVVNPFSEILLLTLGVLLLSRIRIQSRWIWAGLWSIPVLLFATVSTWKYVDAIRQPENIQIRALNQQLAPLRPVLASLRDCVIAGPKVPVSIAFLSSRCGQLYHPWTGKIELIPDEEVNERHALNGWLLGLTDAEYDGTSPEDIALCDSRNPDWQPAGVAADREKRFARISDPLEAERLLHRYKPNYLLLPVGSSFPRRGGKWDVIASTPAWTLYHLDQSL